MNLAIIGLGKMGQRHLENVIRMGGRVSGLVDFNMDLLRKVADDYSLSKKILFADTQSLFNNEIPECIIISTTSPSHYEYTCLAAQSGVKYILCEKPMAISLAQCEKMINVCKQHGVHLAINHQMRFMEQYTLTKRLIMSDEFGGLKSITVIGGNFGLAMNGIHYFEMFRFMTDEEPNSVSAWFSDEIIPNPRGPEFEDRAGCVRVSTQSGKRLYIDVSSDQGHGIQVIYTGRYGQIIVDELMGSIVTTHRMEIDRKEPSTRYGLQSICSTNIIKPADSLAPSLAVLEALLLNKDYPDGNVGKLAVKTLVAAYISHEHGHIPIKINETEPYTNRLFPWA